MEQDFYKHLYEIKEMMARVDERTQNILIQATKTNGRVSKAEDNIDKLQAQHAAINTRVTIISAGIGMAVAAIINMVFK